jgi:hypothetical protein
MAGLVADYNSESEDESSGDSSSESDGTSSDEQEHDIKIDKAQEKLPLPDILSEKPQNSRTEFGSVKMDDHSASVFFNPFKAKEDEKLAILERHVKLTERKDETKAEKPKFRRSKNAQKFPRRQHFNGQNQRNDDDDSGFNQKTFEKRKRRVGVNDSLIPPKKAMQAYEKQRRDEKPRP